MSRDSNQQSLRKQTLNYLAKLAKWLSFDVKTYLYGLIYGLCVLSCHVSVQGDFTPWNCLNFKELVARNEGDIWNLSKCQGFRNHKHLVREWILSLTNGWVWTKWLWARIPEGSHLKLQSCKVYNSKTLQHK